MKSKNDIVSSYMEDVLIHNYEAYDGFTAQELSEQLHLQRTIDKPSIFDFMT